MADIDKNTKDGAKTWKGIKQDQRSGKFIVYVTKSNEQVFDSIDEAVDYMVNAGYSSIIKKTASLSKEHLDYMADKYKDDFDFDSHYELVDEMEYELRAHFDLDNVDLDENDFKNITGLSFEEYDNKVLNNKSSAIKEDFQSAKDNDISTLEYLLNNEDLELSWTIDKVYDLISELESLEHDGSEDLGYRKEHILDRVHKRRM